MRVQILHVPDCPGAVTLSAYLTQLAVDNADVERQVVSDLDQATALGMTGSPTLLIDGADPFAVAGLPPSLSCRLYRDENGSIARAPSLAQLRATLAGTERLATFDPATLDPAWAAAGTAARHAALPGNLRRLHQAILAYFVENGEPPGRSWLGPEARRLGLDPDTAYADLAAADLVHLGEAGQVAVAYPFSGLPTGHRVHLAGGPPVWSMCAIDALGIPQMTGRDGVIVAADPHSGEPVRVELGAGEWRWSPPATAVLVTRPSPGVPSAQCCCSHINFVTSPEHAQAYLASHPELTGELLGQAAAVQLAGALFGPLLG
jgi:hypothetical protein